MKTKTKLEFREAWQRQAKIKPDDVLGNDHLDSMWTFAERKQNQYEGLAAYCGHFDESFLAQVTRRAKMRAILEIPVPAPRDMGKLPSASAVAAPKVPAYAGVGTRRTGSNLVPLTDAKGAVTDEGVMLMLGQAQQQMKGHQSRFEAFLPPAAAKALRAYVRALERETAKVAVRAAA